MTKALIRDVLIAATIFAVGLALIATDAWQSTEFWSAMAGAIVGGLIAYAMQTQVLSEARDQREEDFNRVQRGLANSLLFKMVRIMSSFRYIDHHMKEAYGRAEEGDQPWQFVQPIINPTPRVHFTSEEMGMLLAQKSDDIFNSVASIDEVHNALITVLEQHSVHRQDLMQRLPAPQQVEGEMGRGVFHIQIDTVAWKEWLKSHRVTQQVLEGGTFKAGWQKGYGETYRRLLEFPREGEQRSASAVESDRQSTTPSQHFLYFLPLRHGQGSLRRIFPTAQPQGDAQSSAKQLK